MNFPFQFLRYARCPFVQRFTLVFGITSQRHSFDILLSSIDVRIALLFEALAGVVINFQRIHVGRSGLLIVAVHLVHDSHIVMNIRYPGSHFEQRQFEMLLLIPGEIRRGGIEIFLSPFHFHYLVLYRDNIGECDRHSTTIGLECQVILPQR